MASMAPLNGAPATEFSNLSDSSTAPLTSQLLPCPLDSNHIPKNVLNHRLLSGGGLSRPFIVQHIFLCSVCEIIVPSMRFRSFHKHFALLLLLVRRILSSASPPPGTTENNKL